MKVIDFMLKTEPWGFFDIYYNGEVVTRQHGKTSARKIMLGEEYRNKIVLLACQGDVKFYDEKRKLIGAEIKNNFIAMRLKDAS